ncbi:hypothetical protein [Mycolicibacterium sp.]|uniref:Tc toxin subunit A-related protein n=1 Tax=Mycolicibacterium sp. TaxID=2320850 RepID=UPI0028AD006F|nr:hypothetical protein [Mycolicibacterium sp.]
MTIDPARSFHLAKDAAAVRLVDADLIDRFRPRVPGSHPEQKQIVVRERNLSYQFSPHYHPWVTELTRRLLSGSTPALQAVDTEHQLRVRVSAAVAATTGGVGGLPVTVAVAEVVTLADDVTVTLTGTGAVHLAGRHLLRGDGTPLTADVGNVLRVPAGTVVRRSNRSEVVLAAELTGTLVDGAPTPTLLRDVFSAYAPNAALIPDTSLSPRPADDLDFSSGGAYSVYNWELFFHVPFTIAVNLSRSGRYAEARQWFHFLFDPTDVSAQVSPERYWKVKPFQTIDVQRIETILVNLSTGADPVLARDTINAIQAWKDAPFRPHVVARFRQSAYMFKTVMAYLDNLIAWGDSLFRQDTGEAIDEALQLYVLAAIILGPRPQAVPSKGSVRVQTYATLRNGLDSFGNTMRDVEGSLLFDIAPRPRGASDGAGLSTVRGIGRSLYFGVPRNDKLIGYWDTVADRLFKIRNSLNIEGVFRQLPLFEPPIDPALLARAAAAGLDTSAIIGGIAQRLPLVRFSLLHRQATELAQQVATLGANLLSALEKEDGETLSLLRARHEKTLATLAEQVKYGQLQEAVKSREALVGSLNSAVTRYAYYEQQLGRTLSDIEIPELDELDIKALAAFNLQAAEPTIAKRDVPIDISGDVIEEAAGRLLNRFEAQELELLTTARTIHDVIKIAELAGQGSSMIPDFGVKFHFWGLGGDFGLGGTQLSKFARFAADIATTVADSMNFQASIAAKVGSYARREQDWAQQSSVAASDINQIYKQLRAAQLREAVAQTEWRNHQKQISQLQEVEEFLNAEGTAANGRVANKAMYAWMKREVRLLYSRTFALATELATKAQLALKYEIGDNNLNFVRFDYQAGKEGLLAGEKLLFDLKRMELAYHDNNIRELELTKHISLAQLNPLALITLRATGRCEFDIPEELFDLDGPGHYFRRIRSVAVSIPCVTGPYASINCTLRLNNSKIRTSNIAGDELEEIHRPIEQVVVSSGSQDSGVFDVSGADSRRLPFELSGAISSWTVELPGQGPEGYRLFDYDTISDVILHMRLTAREGGHELRDEAVARLKKLTEGESGSTVGRVRLFSLRHEFSNSWAPFAASEEAEAPLTLTLTRDMFPFWSANRMSAIEKVVVFRPPAVPGDELEFVIDADGQDAPKFNTPWTQSFDPTSRDLWLLATWKV